MANIVVTRPTEAELDELGTRDWGIWTCGESVFDWHYDQKETCYVLEGEVTIKIADEEVSFGAGDLVVFPEGLDCVWEVRSPVKKHYKFG